VAPPEGGSKFNPAGPLTSHKVQTLLVMEVWNLIELVGHASLVASHVRRHCCVACLLIKVAGFLCDVQARRVIAATDPESKDRWASCWRSAVKCCEGSNRETSLAGTTKKAKVFDGSVCSFMRDELLVAADVHYPA
jgi:hypothetical protein